MRWLVYRTGLDSGRAALRALCVSAALVAMVAPAPAAAQDPDSVIVQRGRELTKLFYDREYDRVIASFNDEMRTALGGEAGLRSFREQVTEQVGDETEVIAENVSVSGDYRMYRRSVRFSRFAGTLAVVWTFDGDGMVAGFRIQPEQGSPQGVSADYFTAMDIPLRQGRYLDAHDADGRTAAVVVNQALVDTTSRARIRSADMCARWRATRKVTG